jgi:16S rRNA processing protein RimM
VGLPCFDEAGHPVGTVAAVENFGAGDLLEIEKADGRKALIPFRDPIATFDGDRIMLDQEFLA